MNIKRFRILIIRCSLKSIKKLITSIILSMRDLSKEGEEKNYSNLINKFNLFVTNILYSLLKKIWKKKRTKIYQNNKFH